MLPEKRMPVKGRGTIALPAFIKVKLPEPHRAVEMNVGGWTEDSLEWRGRREGRVVLARSTAKGDSVTEFIVSWK